MRTPDRDHLTFDCTGRTVYAFMGAVGLDGDEAVYGWDGVLGEAEGPLTPEERRELADHMIEAWRAYGERTF